MFTTWNIRYVIKGLWTKGWLTVKENYFGTTARYFMKVVLSGDCLRVKAFTVTETGFESTRENSSRGDFMALERFIVPREAVSFMKDCSIKETLVKGHGFCSTVRACVGSGAEPVNIAT